MRAGPVSGYKIYCTTAWTGDKGLASSSNHYALSCLLFAFTFHLSYYCFGPRSGLRLSPNAGWYDIRKVPITVLVQVFLDRLSGSVEAVSTLSPMGWRVLLGFLFSMAIAGLAYWRRSLSLSGVYGAVLIGTIIFGLGGWPWGLLLIGFFVTSSILTQYRSGQKQALLDHAEKTGCRDLGQTLANGGVGAILAALSALTAGTNLLFFFAFAGAMAAVNADTWATELGVLSREKPRLITTGEQTDPGTSGAISWLGLVASFMGAWAMGLLGLTLQLVEGWLNGVPQTVRLGWLPLVAALGGLAGSLADSLLGATVQATYYCLSCGQETEQPIHRCGRQPIYVRGWHWLDNDWVNVAASLVGALVATGLGALVLYLR